MADRASIPAESRVVATSETSENRVSSLARYAWGVLIYNLLVVAWGGYVRASGSGAGCGQHWPLCNGQVVPRASSVATLIEVTHRVTSFLAIVAVIVLMVWTRRAVPAHHPARRAAIAATALAFGEALVGAGIVLYGLVAHDTSMKRGLSMLLHLCNTFFLLGALVLTAWLLTLKNVESLARTGAPMARVPQRHVPRPVRVALVVSLAAVLTLGASGAIAALGDTLFPAHSLREGLAQDISPLAPIFLRLRMVHPFLAFATGALVLMTAALVRTTSCEPRTRMLARVVTLTFTVQFAVGVLNLSLLAPIGIQIVHLLVADATWLALVLLAWETLRVPPLTHDDRGTVLSVGTNFFSR